jgi:hypothetical protein
MEAEAPAYLWFLVPALFLIFFPAMWLGVTSLLGALSGWFGLQRAFPDRDEPALEQWRMQSGAVGFVRFNNSLRLDICAGGLRIAVSRFLGPFQRPIYVPWASVTAQRRKVIFGEVWRFGFGLPETGSLTLPSATAERIAATGRLKLPAA